MYYRLGFSARRSASSPELTRGLDLPGQHLPFVLGDSRQDVQRQLVGGQYVAGLSLTSRNPLPSGRGQGARTLFSPFFRGSFR
jgi:hypothetical protein